MPSRPPTSLTALLLTCLLALAACGGGGGGGGTPSDPEREILATRPAQGEQDVPETSAIEIDLAVAVDPAATLATWLSVRVPGHGVDGEWTYDVGAKRLTFQPTDPLPVGSELRVELTPGLPYLDGGQRMTPFAFDFETRAPAISAAGYLETAPDPAYASVLALHESGNGVALYGMLRADGKREFSARFKPAGGDFEAQKALVMGEGISASRAGVAVNARGDAVWAWTNSIPSGDLGYCMFYDRTYDTWSTTQLFQAFIGRTMSRPHVAIDDAGNVFFAWQETLDGTQAKYVVARRRSAAGVFEPVQTLDDVNGTTNMLRMQANAAGHAVIAWQQADATGTSSCYGAAYDPTTGWSAQTEIDDAVDAQAYVRGVAIAPNGSAAVLLAANDGAGAYSEIPQIVVRNPLTGWNPPLSMPADRGDLSDYGLHATGDNRFLAVYSIVRDASYVGYVRAVLHDPASGALIPSLLSDPFAEDMDGGSLVASVTPGGEVLVAWTQQTHTSGDTLRAALLRSSGEIVANIPLRTLAAGESVQGLAVAAAPGGGGMVVWQEPDAALAPAARRLPSVILAPSGTPGAITDQQAAPGDVPEAAQVHLDETGRGALLWRQSTSTSPQKDFRYRLID